MPIKRPTRFSLLLYAAYVWRELYQRNANDSFRTHRRCRKCAAIGFRNADWASRPSPELEHQINWRLYKESSGGLMTELAVQLEVCNWAAKRMPVSIIGMGRHRLLEERSRERAYDSVNVLPILRWEQDCLRIVERQQVQRYGRPDPQAQRNYGNGKGIYYLEEDHSTSGIRQLIGQVKDKVFLLSRQRTQLGPETKWNTRHILLLKETLTSTTGWAWSERQDGSDIILSSFCQSCITGESTKCGRRAYCSTVLCLLGNQAMEEERHILFPDEYKIPYMKF